MKKSTNQYFFIKKKFVLNVKFTGACDQNRGYHLWKCSNMFHIIWIKNINPFSDIMIFDPTILFGGIQFL